MEYANGRRQPRPTVRVLRALPPESFLDEGQRQHVQAFLRDVSRDVFLYDLEQPLLRDARSFFPDRTPDRHVAATKAARQPVYEVRDRDGAAWRGAVITDDKGDAWLVHVDTHDAFHASAAQAMSASVSQKTGTSPLLTRLPKPAEYKIRAREEAALQDADWRRSILNAVITGMAAALTSSERQRVDLPAPPGTGAAGVMSIQFVDHDRPAVEGSRGEGLEGSQSMVDLEMRCFDPAKRAVNVALQEVLPLLQHDVTSWDSTFDRSGNLFVWLPVTHAKLAQILAASELDDPQSGVPANVMEPTHLHYVLRDGLTRAVVQGRSMRSLCGCWFVPTKDDAASLPVCPDCEAVMPVARRVTDMIRRSLAVE